MSETIELSCDRCGATEVAPVFGWITIKPSRKSEVVSVPPAKGDFCSQECLTAYVSSMAMQANMDKAIKDASQSLSADPDTGEIH